MVGMCHTRMVSQSWRFNDRESKWHLSADLRHHGSAWYKHHTVPRVPVPRAEQKRFQSKKLLTATAAPAVVRPLPALPVRILTPRVVREPLR